VEAVASLEEILPRVLPGRGAGDRPSR
jgi:hypothetical protein